MPSSQLKYLLFLFIPVDFLYKSFVSYLHLEGSWCNALLWEKWSENWKPRALTAVKTQEPFEYKAVTLADAPWRTLGVFFFKVPWAQQKQNV